LKTETIFFLAHSSLEQGLNSEQFVKSALIALEENAHRSFVVFVPSHSVLLADDVKDFAAGVTKLIRAEDVVGELNDAFEKSEAWDTPVIFNFDNGSGNIFGSYAEASYVIPSSPFVWKVNIESCAANADSEAVHVVDVTTSIINLLASNTGPFNPRTGEIERHSALKQEFEGLAFAKMVNETPSFLGSKTLGFYTINRGTLGGFMDSKGDVVTELIHKAEKNTVAESSKAAMAWYAKGRQSNDPAFRLLCFFTAIEAVFANSPDAPVSETIARFCSTLISTDVNQRAINAASIKKLYGFRSRTVHRGSRDTRWTEASAAQVLLERTMKRILTPNVLRLKRDELTDRLNSATYGAPLEL
jgi:hypothetical protein